MYKGSSVIDRTRKYECLVYAALWLLAFVLPFFNEFMRMADGSEFSWANIYRWWTGLIPFIIVFGINNFILVPRYLLRQRAYMYLLLLLALVAFFILYQGVTYEFRFLGKSVYRFLGLPMPLVMNVALLLMLIAVNTAVIMAFKYVREKDTRKSLETIRLKDEIRLLKAQINPHFFMNMLNNIHAMIELDPLKAQDMTLELSKLMRYVLYEGSNATASLVNEISFIDSYVTLMRRRYPEGKVDIVLELPADPSPDVRIPPMIFITFVENAFKHGVSYKAKSRIFISMKETGDGRISFVCSNTMWMASAQCGHGGVGLDNVRRRLDYLYEENYQLEIKEENGTFDVSLTIPCL